MYSTGEKRGAMLVGILSFILFLCTIQDAYAFGISTPYLENNTLKVLAGEQYVYTLTLQNGDEEGYYVDILYSSTDDVATLDNLTHYIQSKTYDNKIDFIIAIPKDAKPGEEYTLEYSARPRSSSNETVTFGVELKRDVNILVTAATQEVKEEKDITGMTENAKKSALDVGKYLLGAIALLILAFIILRIWKISRKISAKINSRKKTNYSISEAISLAEVRTLLEKITDEEFELIEIRKLFKAKLSELTNNDMVDGIDKVSRREAILALNRILK